MSRKRRYAISAAAIAAAAAGATALLAGPNQAPAKAQAAPPPYVVVGNGSSSGGDSYATCPAGTQLAGGGYEGSPVVNGIDNPVDVLAANTPSTTIPNTWGARMLRGTVRAFAMCVPSSAPPPVVVQGLTSGPGGWSVATCPPGTQLAGGGFVAVTVSKDGYGNPVDTEVASAPSNNNPNSWAERWYRGQSQARAMCTTP
jgi:hypothetical protein